MKYDGIGYLRIKTAVASGALPISGATVRIRGADEENLGVEYTQITDEDGLTATFALPAPSVNYSLIPNPAEVPFGRYDVEVIANGFNTVNVKGVQVFDGISGVLPVNMSSLNKGNLEE